MNDSLEISTLGTLHIRRNGRTVEGFPTRKVEALLAYLACTRRSHPREQLAELLWDDRPQSQSLTNLRTTLSRLNDRLAPFLLITRKAVTIDPEANVWVDAVELSTSLQLHKLPLSTRAVHDLEHALTLYKGNFLDGFDISESRGFEEWLRSERQRLRVGVLQALGHLIDVHIERASFDAGVAHATRLLELDPLREDAHRQMMWLRVASGQRSAALAQYDSCRRILADELGIEPEVATTTLYRQIQSGAFVPPAAPLTTSINVPAQPTRFIGREAELARLEEYLDDPDCRLLTLIGPGGVGKTRLAYEVAKRNAGDFPAGVYSIPLSGVASAQYLASTIAERLTLPLDGSADQKMQLLDALREKHLLLVLDTCEHLLDGMELLADILAVAPGVTILATSRERLNLHGEWLFPVHGLPFPPYESNESNESGAGAQTYPAVQLFEQSARRSGPGFHLDDLTDVARICQLVEGLPLAIELAASWIQHMPCERIASHIQRDLDFLSTNLRDVPERHRSTRTLFEHSWRLLSEAEQSALRKLSIFRGGFDADAAAHIADASLHMLSALVEKSLVRASPSGRYDLHDLLRQFAEEKLRDADEWAVTLEKHLDYYVTWAERAAVGLRGGEQVKWFGCFEAEHDNLRIALEWGIHGRGAETGLRLANALWWFWFRRGYLREGYEWLKAGLARTEGETPTRAYAMVYAVPLAHQLHAGITTSDAADLREVVRIGHALGLHEVVGLAYASMSFSVADYQAAMALFEQAIDHLRRADARSVLTTALFLYGNRARAQGDLTRAEALYQESLDLAQADQNREWMISPLGNLGRLAVYRDDYDRAATLLQQAVSLGRPSGNRVAIADCLIYLGTLEVYRAEYAAAKEHLEETLALFHDVGNQMGIAHAYHCLADLALHQGNDERAAKLVSESLSMSRGFLGNFSSREFSTARLLIVGKLALAHEDYEAAASLFGAAESLREQNGYLLEPLPRAEYNEAVAQVRAPLDPLVFETAWREGHAMAEAEAITFALGYVQTQFDPNESEMKR
jgi:predicted ATPase/DNA-binding SARP family transcriptional activator/tetratricopeptide (TPR) repeat protein